MKEFRFKPSKWIPFRDVKELERVRNIKREDIENHHNSEFKIKVLPDADMKVNFMIDMFHRIKTAYDEEKSIVILLGNPSPQQKYVADMINKFRIDCRNLHIFIVDEWADDEGNVAPETYPQGFMNALKRNFYSQIDIKLRPPEKQIYGPTTENINDYSNMIEDLGGADICYSGPGWTGHTAFVDPDVPEFDAPLEEWKQMGARIVTVNPFTIAQNSLHGSFGASGDMANVPPKAATIGPKDILSSKHRVSSHAITTAGSFVSWQRMVTRLCLHGPVTPQIPSSILQTVPTNVFVSETIAANIQPIWDMQY